ncbi:hypothetical protein FWH58_01515 [Candidatus Saccharibacteria bacterium]|nr:hypothetical protein [Candidatus Saccharibacteria bacterium]
MARQSFPGNAEQSDKVIMRFTPQTFEERLHNTLATLSENVMQETWQGVLSSPLVEHSQEIDKLVERISNAEIGRVAIESAHIYLDETFESELVVEELKKEILLAQELRSRLGRAGIMATDVLFIDDYHSESEADLSKIHSLIHSINGLGYNPEHIVLEKEMFPLAQEICENLVSRGLTVEVATGDEKTILLARHNVELFTFDKDDQTGQASCALLDAALSLVKLQFIGDGIVNILPRYSQNGMSYRGQQRSMRDILKEFLNIRVVPLFNLFSKGDINYDHRQGASHTLRKPINKQLENEEGRVAE